MALWKLLNRRKFKTGAQYLRALAEQGYRVSDWIIDIATKPNFQINKIEWPIPLVRIKLADLGFTGPTTLQKFYETALKLGFENPPPEAALALRFCYDEQPKGEWLRVAIKMDAMIDSDGIPHLPKLGSALGNFYLETYWSYPHAIFHPHNEFVFIKRDAKV